MDNKYIDSFLILKIKKCFFLFYMLFTMIFPIINSIIYLTAFNLISEDILLLTDDGIIIYNIDSKNQKLIKSFNYTVDNNFKTYMNFGQYPSTEEGYIFCRVDTHFYIISNIDNSLIHSMTFSEIHYKHISINPYKSKNNQSYCITNYINDEGKLVLKLFKIEYDTNYSIELEIDKVYEYYEDNTEIFLDVGISCELIYSTNFDNNLLICFSKNRDFNSIVAITFDPENNMSLLYSSIDSTQNNGADYIKSITTKNLCLICYNTYMNNFACLIYNFKMKSWSNTVRFYEYYGGDLHNFNLYYISDNDEYLIIFQSNLKIYNAILFDSQFKVKNNNNEEKNYLTYNFENLLGFYTFSSIVSSSMIFSKNKYYLFLAVQTNGNKNFTINEINEEYNTLAEFDEFNINFIEPLPSITVSTISLPIISSTLLSSLLLSNISIYSSSISSLDLNTISSVLSFSSSSEITNSNPISSSSEITNSDTQYSELSFSSSEITNSNSIFSSSSEMTNSNNKDLELLFSSSEIINSNIMSSNISFDIFKDIDFYYEEDRIIGKTNKTKEEMENNLDELIKIIELGKIYLIYGDNYNITVNPIKNLPEFQSTYVNLSLCEEILREKYKLSHEEILTLLQIEIDKMNEKCLTNKLEYAIYNQKKEELGLSYCKHLNIFIHYDIKNNSLLNKSMVLYYSKLGIDIFDINDPFFNDICYSFSNSHSDIILKDRVSDIYQNYSLCDNNCIYDKLDIDLNSVSCFCQIKTEIDTNVYPPMFQTIIRDTFTDSNFGVLKCYNIIFSSKYKLYNIGFWIFLTFSLFHIPLYIHYCYNGVKSILIFNHTIINKIFDIKKPINNKNEENNKLNLIQINVNLFDPKNSLNGPSLKPINSKNNPIKINKKKGLKIKTSKNYNKKNKIDIFHSQKYYDDTMKNYIKNKESFMRLNKPDIKAKKNNLKIKNILSRKENENINNMINDSNYNLDNYDFKNAIVSERRSFWRIYYICLLSKERILNTFIYKSPFEIKPLKIAIFIFNFACDFALNGFFYSNQKISDKYHYNGNNLIWFTLLNNIVITISSTIVSVLIIKLFNMLTHSNREIKNIYKRLNTKKENIKNANYKESKNIFNKLNKVCTKLKIKIFCYIFLEILILLFFFYYITGFCIIYKETQINWLLDSLISYIFSTIFNILLSCFIAIIYLFSLKYKLKYLYNIVMHFY